MSPQRPEMRRLHPLLNRAAYFFVIYDKLLISYMSWSQTAVFTTFRKVCIYLSFPEFKHYIQTPYLLNFTTLKIISDFHEARRDVDNLRDSNWLRFVSSSSFFMDGVELQRHSVQLFAPKVVFPPLSKTNSCRPQQCKGKLEFRTVKKILYFRIYCAQQTFHTNFLFVAYLWLVTSIWSFFEVHNL